ncbi:hypothetical protein TrCOL_g3073 [Triparma columacea]|uniref:Uncharacterized protein n=1 Tax=Triparma columacea TaxID=722753 RepID=A0A9W7G6W3_9STRA|nr:hypothetical protein TrCOL_g3073 [Triparma columacea]
MVRFRMDGSVYNSDSSDSEASDSGLHSLELVPLPPSPDDAVGDAGGGPSRHYDPFDPYTHTPSPPTSNLNLFNSAVLLLLGRLYTPRSHHNGVHGYLHLQSFGKGELKSIIKEHVRSSANGNAVVVIEDVVMMGEGGLEELRVVMEEVEGKGMIGDVEVGGVFAVILTGGVGEKEVIKKTAEGKGDYEVEEIVKEAWEDKFGDGGVSRVTKWMVGGGGGFVGMKAMEMEDVKRGVRGRLGEAEGRGVERGWWEGLVVGKGVVEGIAGRMKGWKRLGDTVLNRYGGHEIGGDGVIKAVEGWGGRGGGEGKVGRVRVEGEGEMGDEREGEGERETVFEICEGGDWESVGELRECKEVWRG